MYVKGKSFVTVSIVYTVLYQHQFLPVLLDLNCFNTCLTLQDTAARPHNLRRTTSPHWNSDSEEVGKTFHHCCASNFIAEVLHLCPSPNLPLSWHYLYLYVFTTCVEGGFFCAGALKPSNCQQPRKYKFNCWYTLQCFSQKLKKT